MSADNKNVNGNKERIGVYVCHCGTNISAVVDVEDVAIWAGDELADEGVVVRVITNSCAPAWVKS